MQKEKEKTSTAPLIVKLINIIGKAGKNEIFDVEVNNIDLDNKKYQIKLETEDGQGFKYHYYDHVLTIKCSDNRELKIEVIPQVLESGNGDYHNTKILITYPMLNGTEFKIISSVYGWDYDNLIKYSESDYFKKTIYDKEQTMLEVISNMMNYIKQFYNQKELLVLSEVFDRRVENYIQKKNDNLKEAEELLSSLSEEQIYSLKKVLSKRNK